MKKLFLGVAALGMMACNSSKPSDEETVKTEEAKEVNAESVKSNYAVVTDGNEIHWTGYAAVGDKSHEGYLQLKEGNFKVKGNKLVGGEFLIDMTTLENTDLPEEGKFNKAKLVGHLHSEAFFHTDSFPKSTFTVTNAMPRKNDSLGTTHLIEGNLELRGVEKSITFPANVVISKNSITIASSEVTIDRTKWNVNYNSSASMGDVAKDKLIDDKITLNIELKAKKA